MSMTLEQAFEVAINDGINIYVREILVKRGFLDQAIADRLGTPAFLELKYKIAQELARDWGKVRLQVRVLGADEAPEPYMPVQRRNWGEMDASRAARQQAPEKSAA